MKKKKIKKLIKTNSGKVKKLLEDINNDPDTENYKPKFFGDGKVVAYEINGIAKSFCTTSSWPNSEGFDFHFQDEKGNEKMISLHDDEIEVMLSCLNKLNYFQ
jgi:hypothetical protein